MKSFNSIDISLAFNWIFLIAGFVLILAYVFIHYKITIPPISKRLKLILIVTRTAALLIILILIFEPRIILNFSHSVKPTNFIFVDNSNSIAVKDSAARSSLIKSAVLDINKNVDGKNNIYLFSNSVKSISADSLTELNFSGTLTNLGNIFSFISKSNVHTSTVTIISDGIINDGTNPYYSAENIDIPIFTIGVGDTSNFSDMEIKNISYNKFIYANEPTVIQVTIFNNGLSGKTANISFFENNKFATAKNFAANKDGINNIDFFYTPKFSGQTKLTFKIDKMDNEENTANNKKSVFVNILKNKLNILLISGNPSADYSFVKQSLKTDPKLKINEIVQISNNKILNSNNIDSYIDSSNILYLIGFPTSNTPNNILNKIISVIINKNKSFFFLLSANTDLNKLRKIQNRLPFLFFRQTSGIISAQPNTNSDETGLLKNNGEFNPALWNSLPPISISSTDFRAKSGAFVLSRVTVNNQVLPYPLITADNLSRSNSIAVLGYNIWRWKLQANEPQKNIFDSFILNSVKWLNNTSHKNLFFLKADKNIFELGEQINITAQLYDQTFAPIDNAEITTEVNTAGGKFSIDFSSIGNGIYSGKINQLPIGVYNFIASAKVNGKIINKAKIKIRVESSNLERYNTRMNKELLKLISKTSSGKYFGISQYKGIIEDINKFNSANQKEVHITKTYYIFSSEWMLAVVIFLFGLEWFLRKRAGLM